MNTRKTYRFSTQTLQDIPCDARIIDAHFVEETDSLDDRWGDYAYFTSTLSSRCRGDYVYIWDEETREYWLHIKLS